MNPVPRTALLSLLFSLTLPAATVHVHNLTGAVTVKVTAQTQVQVRHSSPQREARPEDLRVARRPGVMLVEARTPDGAPIDLEVEVPYGLDIQVRTAAGRIALSGLFRRVTFLTESGDIELAAPWQATRLSVEAEQEPAAFKDPDSVKLEQRSFRRDGHETKSWRLSDRLADLAITYGSIRGKATSPGRVVVRKLAFPLDAPVRLPWQAPAVLDSLLEQPAPRPPAEPQQPSVPRDKNSLSVAEDVVLFSSDVRMVNVAVSVTDAEGHPITDLEARDFGVTEDAVPQKVTAAGWQDVTFNLALLLDLSGSTRRNREAMKQAALRFLDIVQPGDRVALYALAGNLFHVVSPLSRDREILKALMEAIPEVSGGTPLYDAIVFSYERELRARAGERNAVVVISDGVDNQLHGIGAASRISFGKLERAAAEFNALIYPIFLEPPGTDGQQPGWARKARDRLERLAAATGGRLFPARSIDDLEPVYPLVERELRSLYGIAYYPQNQNFDGAWRSVEVKVDRPGAKVRARTGYYAR